MNFVIRRPYSVLDRMFEAMVPEAAKRARARLDVIERPERFEVKVGLPGVKKEVA